MPTRSPLYDTDFCAWSREQAELLRSGMLAAADIENIAEGPAVWIASSLRSSQ